jgi:NAD(P)-dependent dehydrogenase (short-subunit alcohol dehydrogenase family)
MTTPAMRRYTVTDLMSSAPKAAIEQVVKGIAVEEGRFGVRANTVGVGLLTDGMYQALVDAGSFDERFLEASTRNIALRRFGTAEEIAEAAVFLASARARYVTGQTLMVDGGYAV